MDALHPERIGRYRILGELGRGSMGRVYRAHDPHTDREIALKVVTGAADLPAEAAAEARARFLVEARAAGRLSHPGIVLVYDADVDAASGLPYLAMELVVGRSLTDLLTERGPLPWGEAAELTASIADALSHAHERGIVHRDVKPGNVLITDEGRVKIADFGVAKIADESHTRAGMVLGTPNYMSPEQLRGDSLDGRSDLFALGSMLYEMLTGAPPFRADSLASITHKIVSVDPRPPSFERPGLPAGLESAVLRALAKSPAERFGSAAEMARALRSVDAREAAASAPDAAPTRSLPTARDDAPPVSAPPPRFDRRTALGIGALALVLVVALATGLWLGRDASPAAPAGRPETAPALGPAGAAVPSPRRAAPPEPVAEAAPDASLRILFYNRLRNGTMTVWVDGRKAWSAALDAPRDPLKRVRGEAIRATLPVAAGERTIEVRIVQAGAKIDSRGSVRARFEAGGSRRLRVVLLPYLPKLDLSWDS